MKDSIKWSGTIRNDNFAVYSSYIIFCCLNKNYQIVQIWQELTIVHWLDLQARKLLSSSRYQLAYRGRPQIMEVCFRGGCNLLIDEHKGRRGHLLIGLKSIISLLNPLSISNVIWISRQATKLYWIVFFLSADSH